MENEYNKNLVELLSYLVYKINIELDHLPNKGELIKKEINNFFSDEISNDNYIGVINLFKLVSEKTKELTERLKDDPENNMIKGQLVNLKLIDGYILEELTSFRRGGSSKRRRRGRKTKRKSRRSRR